MSDERKDRDVVGTPIDWEEMYEGRFLKAADFRGKPVTLQIAKVELERLETEKGLQVKGVVSFHKTEKMWAINRTNGICVKTMFGPKIGGWIGKRVTLFPGEVESGRDKGKPAVRVYGSPDIANDIEVEIKLAKKKPFRMTMHKTEVTQRGDAAPKGQ